MNLKEAEPLEIYLENEINNYLAHQCLKSYIHILNYVCNTFNRLYICGI